jgi:2-polyprenyl-3-methyl-5-hydroxy-6-metoxy-1,4-benzoquinol methylase
MEDLPADVVAFYNEGTEIHRVSRGLGRLEFARLTASLLRHLPPAPATIGDVGGGPGVYARWLASRGYAVHLLDPIALHVQQAETASAHQPLASCRVGDARELPFENETLDAILLHGPLYHLTERADRIRALTFTIHRSCETKSLRRVSNTS